MHDYTGKVAVITGAASGIGLAMAERFAAAGMRLVLADIEPAPLAAAAQRLSEAGANVLALPTDVSQAEQMQALAEQTLARFGAVHIVCNNAGVGVSGPLWELTLQDWQWILGVNLWGVIHGVHVFVPHLVAQNEGHVVNTASLAGLVSPAHLGAYNVTKHGVVTLSETLYSDLSSIGSRVGVSVLCPGFVNTHIYASERNRPAALQNPESHASVAARQQRRQEAVQFFAQAMPAAEVAERVLEAISQRHFYILTHEGTRETVQRRMTRIIEGGNPDVILPARLQ